uniref:Uncharacterized protein n=1 Tax=Oryza glaberrima TaxID=4538 RepID=I1Q3T7_ORYGL
TWEGGCGRSCGTGRRRSTSTIWRGERGEAGRKKKANPSSSSYTSPPRQWSNLIDEAEANGVDGEPDRESEGGVGGRSV